MVHGLHWCPAPAPFPFQTFQDSGFLTLIKGQRPLFHQLKFGPGPRFCHEIVSGVTIGFQEHVTHLMGDRMSEKERQWNA